MAMSHGDAELSDDRPETADELREMARRVRWYSLGVANGEVANRLRAYADEFDARAAALEASPAGRLTPPATPA
jgi:hypothetical protein